MFDLALAVTLIPPNGGCVIASLWLKKSHLHQTPTLRITIIERPRDPTDNCSDALGDSMWRDEHCADFINKHQVNHYCRTTIMKINLETLSRSHAADVQSSLVMLSAAGQILEGIFCRPIVRTTMSRKKRSHTEENMVLTLSNGAIVCPVQQVPQRTINQRRTRSRGFSVTASRRSTRKLATTRRVVANTSQTCTRKCRSGSDRELRATGAGGRRKRQQVLTLTATLRQHAGMIVQLEGATSTRMTQLTEHATTGGATANSC